MSASGSKHRTRRQSRVKSTRVSPAPRLSGDTVSRSSTPMFTHSLRAGSARYRMRKNSHCRKPGIQLDLTSTASLCSLERIGYIINLLALFSGHTGANTPESLIICPGSVHFGNGLRSLSRNSSINSRTRPRRRMSISTSRSSASSSPPYHSGGIVSAMDHIFSGGDRFDPAQPGFKALPSGHRVIDCVPAEDATKRRVGEPPLPGIEAVTLVDEGGHIPPLSRSASRKPPAVRLRCPSICRAPGSLRTRSSSAPRAASLRADNPSPAQASVRRRSVSRTAGPGGIAPARVPAPCPVHRCSRSATS